MRTLIVVTGCLLLAVASAPFVSRPRASRGAPVGPADLQAAINAAAPGDTITLEAGVVYTGAYHLPRKTGDGWIVIQTPVSARSRAGAADRVAPDQASGMAKIVSSSGSVITADPGAHHYRFVNVEIAPTAGTFLVNLIDLGSSAATADATPHDFAFDRCYIHGDPAKGSRRGIALNSASTSITNSYFSDFKEVGQDSQAVAGWNGPGPFTLTNNYFEGAGENVMFGGADPLIPNLVPSDITVTHNVFSKPLSWQIGNRDYAGTPWTVKNLFELKNAQRVQIDGNVFQYNWVQAQNGFAILFTVRNQDGNAPWSTVADVSFTNNIVQHVSAGVNILGHDDINTSAPGHRMQIKNNLFLDVGGTWAFGRLFQILNGADDITISHNTALQTETMLFGGDTLPHARFVFTNNIAPHNQYGVIGSGTGVGNPTLQHFFPDATFQGNVIAGGDSSLYPSGNFFPATLAAAGLSTTAPDIELASGSPLKAHGTDGTDPGVDLTALLAAVGMSAVPRLSGVFPVTLLDAVFWLAGGLLAYVYFGYGAVIALAARNRRPQLTSGAGEVPTVTIVIVAYNEQRNIQRRIENLLSLDYPPDRVSIIVASDGSTDDTVALARVYEPAIQVVACPVRRGKAAVLNEVVPLATSEVVVFGDARQEFDAQALAALTRPLADRHVGAVSGELVLRRRAGGASAAGVYWSYEKRIRRWESCVDSTMGVTGAIYAIRRDLFAPFPADTILDDVLIPSRAIHQGLRVVFEPAAIAYDDVAASPEHEFVRKVRTIAGTFQFFAREPWTLNPFQNRIWFQTVSHKALRLTLPIAYLVILVANIALAFTSRFYQGLLVLQVLFYAAALSAAWPAVRSRVRAVAVPHMLVLLSWATVVAFVRYLTGRQAATWQQSTSVPR